MKFGKSWEKLKSYAVNKKQTWGISVISVNNDLEIVQLKCYTYFGVILKYPRTFTSTSDWKKKKFHLLPKDLHSSSG